MSLRARILSTAAGILILSAASGFVQSSNAQTVCWYFKYSTWPACNVPCSCTTCEFCDT